MLGKLGKEGNILGVRLGKEGNILGVREGRKYIKC